MSNFGTAIADAVGAAILTLVVVAFVVGGLVVWLAPIVWGWMKPLIHQFTA